MDESSEYFDAELMRFATEDIRIGFSTTDYYYSAGMGEAKGQLYYAFTGPSLYSDENGILLAEPTISADVKTSLDTISQMNASLDTMVIQKNEAIKNMLQEGRKFYVLYIDSKLQREIEAGKVVKPLTMERLDEAEFIQRFPQGEKAAYYLWSEPDGSYSINHQLANTSESVNESEAKDYVRLHGQPWRYERFESNNDAGKKVISYHVYKFIVHFESARFPVAKTLADNLGDIAAITSFDAALKPTLITDREEIKSLSASLLSDVNSYLVNYD